MFTLSSRHLFISILVLTVATAAEGDELSKDNKRWLKLVKPLVLPEEEELYRRLGLEDRPEFERIFWARRDPASGTASPDNEFKAAYLEAYEDADSRFRTWGDSRDGSDTDCGRVYLLLGPPDMVREGERRRERRQEVLYGRNPEVWTYRGEMFEGGTLQVIFDQYCKLWHSTSVRVRLWDQLEQVARSKVTHPELDYRTRPDGRLVALEDMLPTPSPAMTLLEERRQDFPFRAQPKLAMRTRDGGATYVAGLIRGKAEGLEIQRVAENRTVNVVVSASAMDERGEVVATAEKDTRIELDEEGHFDASYALVLEPGPYTLRVGALDTWTRRGSAVSFPLEVPDYTGDELAFSDLLIFTGSQQEPEPGQENPLAAFLFGDHQLIPRFDDVFSQSDTIHLLCMVYNAPSDPATGKPSIEASYTILSGSQIITQSPLQVLETVDAVPMVGPIPLASFPPGQYIAELKLTDKVTQRAYLQQVPFEIQPAR